MYFLTRLYCEIKIEEKKEENRPITNNGLKNFTSVMTKIKSEEQFAQTTKQEKQRMVCLKILPYAG